MDNLTLLSDLTNIFAPSGHEDKIIRHLKHLVDPISRNVQVDNLGNIMVQVSSAASEHSKKVMLVAHTDEIGMVTRKIDEDGFLKVERLGGVPEKSLASQGVIAETEHGTFYGVMGSKSHHVTPQEEKYVVTPIRDKYVDFGFTSRNDAEESGFAVGTMVGYMRKFFTRNDLIFANSLDNRAGCYVLLNVLKELAGQILPCELWIVFSSQEEFSLRGVIPAVKKIKPDIAIAVDCCIAGDTPDLSDYTDVKLGNGPAMGMYSFHGRGTLGGLIPNPKFAKYVQRVADTNDIPLQRYVWMGGLTDSSFLQLEEQGIPSLDLSFPIRYSHSPVEVVNKLDLDRLSSLLVTFITSISHMPSLDRG